MFLSWCASPEVSTELDPFPHLLLGNSGKAGPASPLCLCLRTRDKEGVCVCISVCVCVCEYRFILSHAHMLIWNFP